MLELIPIKDFKEFYSEFSDYIDSHYSAYSETLACPDGFCLDLDLFQQVIDLGVSYAFYAEVDGEFVGYISTTVSPCLLFKGEKEAAIDQLYLTNSARGKGYAKEAVSKVERFIKDKGISRILLSLPDNKAYDALAESFAYKKQTAIYSKALGE